MLSADYTHKLSEDLFTPSNLVGQKQSFATDTVTTDLEDQIGTRLTTGGVALTMNVHPANDFTVTSISSYRRLDRKSVVLGKRVSASVDHGGRRDINKKIINSNGDAS